MAYNPVTDFLALLRQTSGGVRTERMPGLDYVIAALERAGLFRLYVGQTPPLSNQPITVWLRPSVPSWVAEGTVLLWDASISGYALANPDLWAALFLLGEGATQGFQVVNSGAATVAVTTATVAIERAGPASTALALPSIAARPTSNPLRIVDWSTSVVEHAILLNPNGADTIMKSAQWTLYSTTDQRAGMSLYPVRELSAWIIAP